MKKILLSILLLSCSFIASAGLTPPPMHYTLDEWHLTTDNFGGLKQSTVEHSMFFAVSKFVELDNAGDTFEIPAGYHWASKAQAQAAIAGKSTSTKVYTSQGGWAGLVFEGKSRFYFIFSGGSSAGMHANNTESHIYNSGLVIYPMTQYFAGLILIAELSLDEDGDGVFDIYNPIATCHVSNTPACDTSVLDAYPDDARIAFDTDEDGAPDAWIDTEETENCLGSGETLICLDAFPEDDRISVDTDGDGVPNTWIDTEESSGCLGSGETRVCLDAYPDDNRIAADADGDGAPDAWVDTEETATCLGEEETLVCIDAFPTNFEFSTDADGDGVPDSYTFIEDCDSDPSCDASVLDVFPDDDRISVDTDGDGAPNTWVDPEVASGCLGEGETRVCLDAYPDDDRIAEDADGDGVPDAWVDTEEAAVCLGEGEALVCIDAFPSDFEFSTDADGDGVPDSYTFVEDCDNDPSCDTSVLDAFPEDINFSRDEDKDGVPDSYTDQAPCNELLAKGVEPACDQSMLDAFPEDDRVSVDADNDGKPDEWNDESKIDDCDGEEEELICLDTLLNDSDNDGFDNEADALPNNAAASADSDGDGSPDSFNENCDATCQNESGLVIDAFADNADASVDEDQDGKPDEWNEGCEEECRDESELEEDEHLNDIDNDGIGDKDDEDFAEGLKLQFFQNGVEVTQIDRAGGIVIVKVSGSDGEGMSQYTLAATLIGTTLTEERPAEFEFDAATIPAVGIYTIQVSAVERVAGKQTVNSDVKVEVIETAVVDVPAKKKDSGLLGASFYLLFLLLPLFVVRRKLQFRNDGLLND